MIEKTNRASDKFMLRLPDGVRDRVKAVADHNRRSMTAEIVEAIENHLAVEEYRMSPENFNYTTDKAASTSHGNSEWSAENLPATKADVQHIKHLLTELTRAFSASEDGGEVSDNRA